MKTLDVAYAYLASHFNPTLKALGAAGILAIIAKGLTVAVVFGYMDATKAAALGTFFLFIGTSLKPKRTDDDKESVEAAKDAATDVGPNS